MYLAVRHFRDLLEGRKFHIQTDHKPLIFAFKQRPEKSSPRQINYLSFISQFTTDIRYIKGEENNTADLLSRIETINSTDLYAELAEAQESDEELQQLLTGNPKHSMQLTMFTFPQVSKPIYCDVAYNRIRPFVTKGLRKSFFNATHGLSHPGRRASARLMAERFIWPNIRQDSVRFAKTCEPCQRTKVHRHTKTELKQYPTPDERFAFINIDVVGPFPPSEDQRYLLTIIDRYTRWPEAIPMPDMTAVSCAKALVSGWIARFGSPVQITSDQGRQFTSAIFTELCKLIGTNHTMTTAYHPQSNGIVERFHRTVKAAINCNDSTNWVRQLPLILLGLRATIKEDLGVSPAELVLGTSLRLPADLLAPSIGQCQQSEFAKEFRLTMQRMSPKQTSWHVHQHPFIHKDLKITPHVFVRNDSVKASIVPPYEGPFKVIERHAKFFILDMRGRNVKVSLDRLKPAYIENYENETNAQHLQQQSSSSTTVHQQMELPTSPTKAAQQPPQNIRVQAPRTRSGRRINIPSRY